MNATIPLNADCCTINCCYDSGKSGPPRVLVTTIYCLCYEIYEFATETVNCLLHNQTLFIRERLVPNPTRPVNNVRVFMTTIVFASKKANQNQNCVQPVVRV